ncbi:CDC27 family protein [Polyangium sp. y55x31]|uniref:tetratricopeptide repeat protein n=1 Tax=Polyangium sp. y55x31 TaxID=3042688 RepID=UPI0024825177|nr:CDC27 family protein [Polyangium sp. y55x31]MDI1475767.1 CDC27 family protein [Polyangium sp. y55x31]
MRRSPLRWLSIAPFVACLLVAPAVLGAGPAKPTPEQREARALFDQGLALSDEGKWAEALEAFRKSDDISPSTSVRFNIAASLRALGRYVEARDTLDGAVTDAEARKVPIKPALKTEIDKLREEVIGKIVRLELQKSPADAEVTVDGAPMKLASDGRAELDPGKHVFVISAKGHDTTTVTKSLSQGDTSLLLTAPRSASTEAPKPQEPPFYKRGWFWGTVGGVVGVAAAVTVIVVVTRPGETPATAGPPTSTIDRVFPATVRF